jgi:CHAD domain-containing protein
MQLKGRKNTWKQRRMLTKKKQRQYLHEKERQWLNELAAFGETRDEDALHRLRLGIKKIRALVRLSASVRGKRPSAELRPLKRMFRQAGMIRDTRSELRLLEQHQLLSPEHRERRVLQLQQAADKFSKCITNYRKEGRKAARSLLADVEAIRSGEIRRWFAVEIIQIGILLTKSGDDLHLARKKIKTLLYVQKILPQKQVLQLRLDRDYLDTVQDAIGNWHDTVVAVTGWPNSDDVVDRQLTQKCREMEQVVRELADDFHRKLHR